MASPPSDGKPLSLTATPAFLIPPHPLNKIPCIPETLNNNGERLFHIQQDFNLTQEINFLTPLDRFFKIFR